MSAETFDGLAGELGDEFEILGQVEHCAPGQLGGRGDDQVGDGRRAVLTASSQEGQDDQDPADKPFSSEVNART